MPEIETVLNMVLLSSLKEIFRICCAYTHVPSLELESTDTCLAGVRKMVCFRITALATTSAQLGKISGHLERQDQIPAQRLSSVQMNNSSCSKSDHLQEFEKDNLDGREALKLMVL